MAEVPLRSRLLKVYRGSVGAGCGHEVDGHLGIGSIAILSRGVHTGITVTTALLRRALKVAM